MDLEERNEKKGDVGVAFEELVLIALISHEKRLKRTKVLPNARFQQIHSP